MEQSCDHTENMWRRNARPLLALGSFSLLLLGGMLVPIYYDETGWRFQERAWIDGGLDIGYTDLCGPNTIARAPLFMLPVRAFSALANLNMADPLFIRIEGVLCALVWVALFWVLTAQAIADVALRRNLRTLAFAILGLGFLPYMMVLSRPEQPLILTTTLAIIIALARWPALAPNLRIWAKCAAITVLAVIALSYHLKGVPYALVFLACLAVCSPWREGRVPKVLAAVVVVTLTVIAAQYWSHRFSCPEDPQVAAQVSSQVGASLLAGKFDVVLSLLPQMMAASSPLNYIKLVAPTAEPLSAWLPWGLFSWQESLVGGLILLVTWGAALTVAIIRLVNHSFAKRMGALLEPRFVLALAILGVVLVWGASQLKRNDYEAAHVLPMLAVFVGLCAGIPVPSGLSARILKWLSIIILPLAVAAQAIVAARVLPILLASVGQPGLVSGQPFSVSVGGYPRIREAIQGAMVAAGIPTDRRLKRLVVDDLTYLALQRSYLPLHDVGLLVIEPGKIASVDPARYLISRGSDGVVIACQNMPPNFRGRASRSGPICALSRRAIEELASSASSSR